MRFCLFVWLVGWLAGCVANITCGVMYDDENGLYGSIENVRVTEEARATATAMVLLRFSLSCISQYLHKCVCENVFCTEQSMGMGRGLFR